MPLLVHRGRRHRVLRTRNQAGTTLELSHNTSTGSLHPLLLPLYPLAPNASSPSIARHARRVVRVTAATLTFVRLLVRVEARDVAAPCNGATPASAPDIPRLRERGGLGKQSDAPPAIGCYFYTLLSHSSIRPVFGGSTHKSARVIQRPPPATHHDPARVSGAEPDSIAAMTRYPEEDENLES